MSSSLIEGFGWNVYLVRLLGNKRVLIASFSCLPIGNLYAVLVDLVGLSPAVLCTSKNAAIAY